MKGLSAFLTETMQPITFIMEAGGFVNLIDINEIAAWFKQRSKKASIQDNADKIQDMFSDLFTGMESHVLYSENDTYLKIPYSMIPVIQDKLTTDSSKDFYYEVDKKNDKKYYIKAGFAGGVKLSETGSGNYGSKSLDKEIHENLTSFYYNTPEEFWPIVDTAVEALYSYADLKIWIPTWHEHAIALRKECGEKLRAVRIDNAANIRKVYAEIMSKVGKQSIGWDGTMSSQDGQVNTAYDKLSNAQKSFIIKSKFETARLKRESYDKSDIVLYDPSKISDIQKAANIKDDDDLAGIRGLMIELYNNKALIGISLKGLSKAKGHFEMVGFNVDDDPEHGVVKAVKDYSIDPILRIKRGKTTVMNGFITHITTTDNESMILALRSFGANAALEVKYSSKPPLGKSPVFLWRTFVDEYSKKTPLAQATSRNLKNVFTAEIYNKMAARYGWEKVSDDTVFEFESTNVSTAIGLQFLYSLLELSDKDIIENLTTWAKAAVAEADYAFPFLLTEEI